MKNPLRFQKEEFSFSFFKREIQTNSEYPFTQVWMYKRKMKVYTKNEPTCVKLPKLARQARTRACKRARMRVRI